MISGPESGATIAESLCHEIPPVAGPSWLALRADSN